ncbi:MAG TPA: PAS domain-containing sensor histidine kinase [Coxiellaceae bacterium]|nr:PAS domain-containing sensor histidine kinase [Coxiellaceae bacterium]
MEYNLSWEDLLLQTPAHLYWKDIKGVYQWCNDIQAKSFGLSSNKEVVGKTDYDLLSREEAEKISKIDANVMKNKNPISLEEIASFSNNPKAIFLSKKIPLRDKKGRIIGLFGISFDITDVKRYEGWLIKEKEIVEIALDNIIANLPGHVYWKDKNFKFIGCNNLQANSFGFLFSSEIVGKDDFELLDKKEAKARREIDEEIIKTGVEKTAEEMTTYADGKKRFYLSKKTPLLDGSGNIQGILGISFDITEQKVQQEEIRRLEAENARLKALAPLGGMLAHELRTPLTGVSMSIESLQKIWPHLLKGYFAWEAAESKEEIISSGMKQRLPEALDRMLKAVQYCQATITNILHGIHQTTSTQIKVEDFSLKAVLEQALDQYPFTPAERKLIHLMVKHDVSVRADSAVLILILHNWIKNALHAIREAHKGDITIAVKVKEDQAIIEFKDTAKGIEPDVMNNMFEPFFTTKKGQASIGMGLYFCKIAAMKMGTPLACESEVGHYTLFTLSLPLADTKNRKTR